MVVSVPPVPDLTKLPEANATRPASLMPENALPALVTIFVSVPPEPLKIPDTPSTVLTWNSTWPALFSAGSNAFRMVPAPGADNPGSAMVVNIAPSARMTVFQLFGPLAGIAPKATESELLIEGR